MQQFDLVIIGGGPAGYTGAIRAAQLGMKVACVEKRSTLGGTCLNVGCIPSKALLNFSEKYEDAKKHFGEFGIKTEVSLELDKMLAKKDKVVTDLCKGIDGLFAKNKITKFTGHGKILANNIVEIENSGGIEKISAKNILIATGSSVIDLPGISIDEEVIVSSTGALALKKVPAKMAVIGGGYIGLELGSVWRRLGAEVTVIEFADKIVPALDSEIGHIFTNILQKQGMEFKLGTKVLGAKRKNENEVVLSLEDVKTSAKEEIVVNVALVAIGRKPYTDNLGLDKIGIVFDKQGRIEVSKHYETNISGIYAVGDVIKGPMLAHKAEEEAVAAVEYMAGSVGHVNYKIIPSVVYTSPEVASVGATEEELKAAQISYKVGKFPFLANSRARASGFTDGIVKILAESKSDEILGAHIIGPDAGTLIAEIAVAMEFKAAAEDIARTCHAHPTLNEALKEAALAVDKRTINL